MKVVEIFEAKGHKNIVAKNRTTFEVTKESWLTKRGDCIIAVGALKGASEISEEFKRLARKDDAVISVTVEASGFKETAIGRGSSRLTFNHLTDIVMRKSTYTCGRTIMVDSDKSASDFSLELIQMLKNPNQIVKIELSVEVLS